MDINSIELSLLSLVWFYRKIYYDCLLQDLNSFLSVAEELRVKGLTQNPSSAPDPPASTAPATKAQCPLPAREERERQSSPAREDAGGRARQTELETRSRLPAVKTEPPQPVLHSCLLHCCKLFIFSNC